MLAAHVHKRDTRHWPTPDAAKQLVSGLELSMLREVVDWQCLVACMRQAGWFWSLPGPGNVSRALTTHSTTSPSFTLINAVLLIVAVVSAFLWS